MIFYREFIFFILLFFINTSFSTDGHEEEKADIDRDSQLVQNLESNLKDFQEIKAAQLKDGAVHDDRGRLIDYCKKCDGDFKQFVLTLDKEASYGSIIIRFVEYMHGRDKERIFNLCGWGRGTVLKEWKMHMLMTHAETGRLEIIPFKNDGDEELSTVIALVFPLYNNKVIILQMPEKTILPKSEVDFDHFTNMNLDSCHELTYASYSQASQYMLMEKQQAKLKTNKLKALFIQEGNSNENNCLEYFLLDERALFFNVEFIASTLCASCSETAVKEVPVTASCGHAVCSNHQCLSSHCKKDSSKHSLCENCANKLEVSGGDNDGCLLCEHPDATVDEDFDVVEGEARLVDVSG